MRRMGRRAALAACAAVILAAAALAADAKDAKTISLQGTAVWNGNNKTATVTAMLTPTAEKGTYEAAWEFVWQGTKNTWKGKVQFQAGGAVVGDGSTMDGKRTFVFRAKNAGGTITGQHWETTSGKEKLSGTLAFKI